MSSASKRLSPEWCEAIRANQLGAIRDRRVRGKTAHGERQKVQDSFPHSAELIALVAHLKGERLRRGLSLGDVARVTDQARSAISRLENGLYPNPTFNTVYRYALALDMRIVLIAEPLRVPSKTEPGQA
jgi:hypothetical protein